MCQALFNKEPSWDRAGFLSFASISKEEKGRAVVGMRLNWKLKCSENILKSYSVRTDIEDMEGNTAPVLLWHILVITASAREQLLLKSRGLHGQSFQVY